MKTLFIKLTILSLFLLIGCKDDIEKQTKINPNQNLGEGEWLNSSDTLNGISIRENKIAFFKNMEFKSDQIFEYVIVDSIHKIGESKKKIGEYLIVTKNQDSTIFKIQERNPKYIVLLDSKQIPVVYNFWKRLNFNSN